LRTYGAEILPRLRARFGGSGGQSTSLARMQDDAFALSSRG